MDGWLEVVVFTAGGARFAIEAGRVRALLSRPLADSMAAEALLRLSMAGGDRRWLDLGGVCLEVSDPVTLTSLSADDIHPLPPLLAARLTIPGVRALAFDAHGVIMVLGTA